MIEITTHVRSVAAMRATAAYLNALAIISEAEAQSRTDGHGSGPIRAGQPAVGASAAALHAPALARIAPEDNPETGAPLPPPVVLPDPALAAAAAAAFGAPAALVPSVPLPPPVVAAPAAPVSASGTALAPSVAPAQPDGGSVNVAGKQIDSRGLPHDGRIHSSPPTITAEGIWRKKRGLNDPALVARVEAELLAGQAVPAPAASVPVLPPPVISAAAASVGLPVAPAVGGVPAIPVPAAMPAVSGPTDLPSLMQQVAPMLAAQRMDMARVLEACKAAGVDSLTVLQSRPDLVPTVWAQVLERVTA